MPTITCISTDGDRFTVDAEADDNVLDALIFEGHPVSYCCRIGMCGMCKAEVEEGEVRMDEPDLEGLTADDREQGRVLLCRCVAPVDCVVRMVHGNAAPPDAGVPAIVMQVEELDERWTLTRLKVIEPAPPFVLHPAQQVLIDRGVKAGTEERRLLRAHLGSAVPAAELEFFVDRHGIDRLGQSDLEDFPRPGTPVHFGAASGTTPAELADGTPILLIAEGSGILALRSILQAFAAENRSGSIHAHWRPTEAAGLQQHMREALSNLHPPIAVHDDAEGLTQGLLDTLRTCQQEGLAVREIRAYLYASPETNAALRKILLDAGMKPWRINAELIR